jgi:hypothetical protein
MRRPTAAEVDVQQLKARRHIAKLAPEGYGYEDIAVHLRKRRIRVTKEWLRDYVLNKKWKNDVYLITSYPSE